MSKLPEGWRWVSTCVQEEDYVKRTDEAIAYWAPDEWLGEAPDGTILRSRKIRGPISAARAMDKKYPLGGEKKTK